MTKVEIGNATLYLADCFDVIEEIRSQVGAVVSDPPYGMAWNTNSRRFSGGRADNNRYEGQGRDWAPIRGDDKPFDPSPWLSFPSAVLWGANHFSQRLPVGSTLVWIKKPPGLFGTFLSDCEIGWAMGGYGVYAHYEQFPPPSRIAEAAISDKAAHPTQKPIGLMHWCITTFGGEGTVLDPFMGSGTTGVACAKMGRPFIGIEREPAYFEAACRRIEAVERQPDPFVKPETMEQESLL